MKKKMRWLCAAFTMMVLLTGCAAGKVTEDVMKIEETAEAANEAETQEETAETEEETTVKEKPTPAPTPTPTPEVTMGETMMVDLSLGEPENFEIANGWCNGDPFNVTWRKDNVTFADGRMQLIIDADETPSNGIPYSGGEFRSREFFCYGRYEVSMKAIKNDGVVSSFFTYTGPSDGNPWDEIDIEILGKNTEKVQFNYYTNGRGNHEYMYELGFDAAEEFHTYAFEWHKNKIMWFVDGEHVHTAIVNIPVTEGKIMMNAWCGKGVDGWLKAFDDANLPLVAEYQWFSYTPFIYGEE